MATSVLQKISHAMGPVSRLGKLTATELALIPSRRKRGYVETSASDMMKPVMVSV